MSNARTLSIAAAGVVAITSFTAAPANASSHMDAPLITLDDAANTTDVYAFLSKDPDSGVDYLTTALAVYPFEEPGIGPNNYRFDDRVIYEIHVALDGRVDLGRPNYTYRFEFDTEFAQNDTIRQSFLGVVDPFDVVDGFPRNQNMRQTYTLTKIDNRRRRKTVLGSGVADGLIVPPNNQGIVTPFYNQGDDGDNRAKEGVASANDLDPYTASAVAELDYDYRSFAGQREDGFFADIQSVFDLEFSFGRDTGTPTKPFDSQGGFNVHTIVLDIPLAELKGAKLAGVYATTTRKFGLGGKAGFDFSIPIQVGRQGNPLFNEAAVALRDKDRYNQTNPVRDRRLFAQYADDPEVSRLLGVTPIIDGLIRSIYIPDLIKVDLTTEPARLAGDPDFNRLGFFGGDMLQSTFQDPFGNGGLIPGGWPNGRRFGDDVLDVALIALGAAGPGPDFSGVNIDRVDRNDITYNDVFPYAGTPLNGRNHGHHDESDGES